MKKSTGWSDERRAQQAAAIHLWQPWSRATGPKTAAGKAISSRNADKPNSLKRQLRAFLEGVKRDLRQAK